MNLAKNSNRPPGARGVTPAFAWLFVSVLLAAPVLLATPAAATTMVHFGTAQLADLSGTIVRGTVESVEARLHPEHQFIYTYVSVRVDEVFKGDAALVGSIITLEELGGRVDRSIHLVEGVPHFEAGEEVLCFLENREAGLYRTYGMVQGKFRLETDPGTGTLLLTRPADLSAGALAPAGEAIDLSPARPDGNYDAETFLRALREWSGR